MQKSMLFMASFLMAIAVIFGALGAHALSPLLSQTQMNSFETGLRYQAWHALAIILVQVIPSAHLNERSRKSISILFLLGIVCFSFSIYLLNLRYLLNIENLAKFLGPITPVGGILFIGGWILLCTSLIRTKSVI